MEGTSAEASTTFLVVSDPDEEAEAIRDLARFATSHGGSIAPVLDRDGLVNRIEDCWRHAGREYETKAFAAVRHTLLPARAGGNFIIRRPDLILATPEVDVQLRRLAFALTDTSVADLASTPSAPGATAIVFAAPEDMDGSFVASLERLGAGGVVLGIVPVEAGVEGRCPA